MFQITSPIRFIFFILAILGIIVLIAGVSAWGTGTIQRSGEFEISSGSSAASVWGALADQGFASRRLPFQYEGWRQDAATSIQAGIYRLEAGEKAGGVVRRFIIGDVSPDELTLTFPEGFTLQQIAARAAARGIGSEEEYLTAASPSAFADKFTYLANIPEGRSLEGYLFPDTYRVFADDTPADVIARMLANFDSRLTADLRLQAAEAGRTLDEIIIMASIIEREVLSDEDMAVVAGILWQRLDDGAGLDADGTVRYALNKWDGALTVDDLATDSPYNTRTYRGLPPGPISNPGLRAIMAAVEPQESEFYYYLSAPNGETIFSKTNDEHNANKVKYLR